MNQPAKIFFNELAKLKVLDWAILLNAIAILNLKAVPWFLTLLLLVLAVSFVLKQAKWGQLEIKTWLILTIPFCLGLIGLLVSENQNKGFEELSRVLPFLIFPVVLNCWKPSNKLFFIRLAISVFILALIGLLLVNFYESLVLYQQTGKTYHFFYTHFVKDINIVSFFILFALLVLLEYFLKLNWSMKRLPAIIVPFFLLLIALILLEGRIVIAGFWAALVFLFFYYRSSAKRWVILPILAISIGVFFLPSFQSRFSKISGNFAKETKTENQQTTNLEEVGPTESYALHELSLPNEFGVPIKPKSIDWKEFQPFIFWLVGAALCLVILAYFIPLHRILLLGLITYAALATIFHFTVPPDGNYLKVKKLVAQQDAGELFTKPNVASEKYRLNALIVTLELIQKKPLVGYGAGDWRDAMTLRYLNNGMIANFIEQTAPHNQYVRTWLRHGAIGWVVFMSYLLFLTKTAWRSHPTGILAFVLCLLLCAVGYDIFDVGGSIPFIAFFSTLFLMGENNQSS